MNAEALPQFKHSAAGLPSALDRSRNASLPQCGHTNFTTALSIYSPRCGRAQCAGGIAWDARVRGMKASMSAPRKDQAAAFDNVPWCCLFFVAGPPMA